MATQEPKAVALKISPEAQEKFPDLIEMIKVSPSMKEEERQYWVDALPVMTDDQVQNLRGILENEKAKIEEADKNFNKGVQGAADKAKAAFDEAAYREKKKLRVEAEQKEETAEAEAEADILSQLENL